MKTLRALLWPLVMLVTLCSFGSALALADGAPTASGQAPPQDLAALWPMIGLFIATFAGWGIPKLADAYTIFHTPIGAVFIGLIGALIGSVIPILQSGSVSWSALVWALVSGGTAFFARLNPSTTATDPPAKSPAARPGASSLLPLLFLPLVSVLMALPGCATAGGRAFGKCELGQLVAHEQTVAVDVTAIAVAGGDNWEQQLTSLGATLAPGQLECAITAIVAAWSSKRGEMAPSRQAALERLNQYLAAHPAPTSCGPAPHPGVLHS